MFGKINDLEISAPSEFSEGQEVIGGFNTTINGSTRRFVNATKKRWTLTYNNLSLLDYNRIYTEFAKQIPTGLQEENIYALFTVYDLDITDEQVLIEVSSRDFFGQNFSEKVVINLIQI